MPTKDKLIRKLTSTPAPRGFTIKDYESLMLKCNCEKYQGGRGSGVGFRHKSGRKIIFDLPHPRKELSKRMIEKVIRFLEDTGEL